MRLSDIGSVRQQLSQSPAFADPLWDDEAGVVTSFQLTMFRARMASHGLALQGDEAVDVLMTEAIKAILSDQSLRFPFLNHPVIAPRFMMDELAFGLGRMSNMRAQAVLLALEEGQMPDWAINLTWNQVLKMTPSSRLSIDVLRTRNACRHIKLSYVFWEFVTPAIAAPLLNLRDSALRAFRCDWHELQLSYSHMAKINRHAEVDSFKLLLNQGCKH